MLGKSVCLSCKKEFEWKRSPSELKKSKVKYCSRSCLGKNTQKDKIFSWDKLNAEQKIERLIKSFEKKVIKQDGCWDWKCPSQKNGYLRIRFDIEKIGAHCASWLIHKGKIPEGFQINHHCDNRRCTNPDHLYLGTRKQNDEDRVRRNRQAKGEKNGSSKLTDHNVEEIKRMLELGIKKSEIAKAFNVTNAAIWFIETGRSWKHI